MEEEQYEPACPPFRTLDHSHPKAVISAVDDMAEDLVEQGNSPGVLPCMSERGTGNL